MLQPGLVNYKENSDREVITRVEARYGDPDRACEAIWIAPTVVFPEGTPYGFHLQRKHLRPIREDGCGDEPGRFRARIETYRFVADADSESVGQISPNPEILRPEVSLNADEKSNANLWQAISVQDPVQRPQANRDRAKRITSMPDFARTAWVLARKDIKAHYVGVVHGMDQAERVTPIEKTRIIRMGEAGQIEARNGQTALVRFYAGSNLERFARKKNVFRRWYDEVGGPYAETKDDLFSTVRAYIVQVSLTDIVELNNYLDEQNTDRK